MHSQLQNKRSIEKSPDFIILCRAFCADYFHKKRFLISCRSDSFITKILNTMVRNVSSIDCFAYILAQTNDKALGFFFKRCVVTSTMKILETNFRSSVLMISFAFEMKKVHKSATFHLIKMVKRLSYFAYISTRDSDSTFIFLSEDAASKTRLKQCKQTSIA